MRDAAFLEVCFPRLKGSGYAITSDKADRPNCIGWALQSSLYFDPVGVGGGFGGYYWPSGIRADDSAESWRQLFEMFGFEECPTNDVEADTEKIAIYIGSDGEQSHVARQLPSGHWTSKMGNLEDIQHTTLDDLLSASADYIQVVTIMKRPRG